MLFKSDAHYYVTRGVNDSIEDRYIRCIIDIINLDRQNNVKADYLKIFHFSKNTEKDNIIQIKESQEVPSFMQTLEITGHLEKSFKVWVISDEGEDIENVTILFPEEY